MWVMMRWWLPVWLMAVGCGGVYEDYAPSRKDEVALAVVPDFVRVGDDLRQVDVFVEVDPEGAFVTGLSMGRGVEVIAFDSRENRGCGVSAVPEAFTASKVFRLCVNVRVQGWVQVGMHEVEVDVYHPRGHVIGRAPFFVLSRLP